VPEKLLSTLRFRDSRSRTGRLLSLLQLMIWPSLLQPYSVLYDVHASVSKASCLQVGGPQLIMTGL
jgi:hypothetical protein